MIMTTTVYMASAIWSPAVTIGAEHFGVSELVSTLGITTFGKSPHSHPQYQLKYSGGIWSWTPLLIANIRSTLHRKNGTLHHLPTLVLRSPTPHSRLQPYRPIPSPSIPSWIRRVPTPSYRRSNSSRYLLPQQTPLRNGYIRCFRLCCTLSRTDRSGIRNSRNGGLDMAILGDVFRLPLHPCPSFVFITGNIKGYYFITQSRQVEEDHGERQSKGIK
jgi:hypothetical protein